MLVRILSCAAALMLLVVATPIAAQDSISGGQSAITGLGQAIGGGGSDAKVRELWAALESNPDKSLCGPMFGDP